MSRGPFWRQFWLFGQSRPPSGPQGGPRYQKRARQSEKYIGHGCPNDSILNKFWAPFSFFADTGHKKGVPEAHNKNVKQSGEFWTDSDPVGKAPAYTGARFQPFRHDPKMCPKSFPKRIMFSPKLLTIPSKGGFGTLSHPSFERRFF